MPDPLRKKPAFPAPWPPPNFKSKRYVGLDMNFVKLGVEYGRSPMELIQFNLRTTDPHEINARKGCRRDLRKCPSITALCCKTPLARQTMLESKTTEDLAWLKKHLPNSGAT